MQADHEVGISREVALKAKAKGHMSQYKVGSPNPLYEQSRPQMHRHRPSELYQRPSLPHGLGSYHDRSYPGKRSFLILLWGKGRSDLTDFSASEPRSLWCRIV